MKTLTITLLLFIGQLAQAGAANVQIDCLSDSGRTSINGHVPGDNSDFALDFTIDGQTLSYFIKYDYPNEEKNAEISIYDAIRDGVYSVEVISVESNKRLRFHAVPGSVKMKKSSWGAKKASFKAKISPWSSDPRKTGYDVALEKTIYVNCSYNYSL